MSTNLDLVLHAIGDGAANRAALVEHTGLEPNAVSQALFALQKKGQIAKGAGGWELAGAPPARPKVHEAVDPIETRPRQPETKPLACATIDLPAETKAPELETPERDGWYRDRPAVPAPVVASNGRECEFAISESGAVLFKVTHGPKAGELGEINHLDVMALYRLLNACDFIRENA